MTELHTGGFAPRHALYAIGYGLISAWATVLLFASPVAVLSAPGVVSLSMLSGLVACLGVLLLRGKLPPFRGRTTAASVYATCMAVGTLLCTYPALANDGLVNAFGLVLSGFFAILLILAWFDVFARLAPRTIIVASGLALLASAVACCAILALPAEVASVAMAAMPIASFSLLPRVTHAAGPGAPVQPPLRSLVRAAVSWKTLLGIGIAFFVIGAVGVIGPALGAAARLGAADLAVPAVLALLFAAAAIFAPARIDAAVFFKLLLVAVAGVAFFMVSYGSTDLAPLFFVYIAADVTMWTVLGLAAKRTPAMPYAVFAVGWLAECAGNVLGHQAAAVAGGHPAFLGVVLLLVLVAVGFAFGDGLFVLELEDGVADRYDVNAATTQPGEVEPATVGASGADESANRMSKWRNADEATVAAADEAGAAHALDGAGASLSAEAAPKSEAAASDAEQPTAEPDSRAAITAFAQTHGLSARETDVFALWVTGHGLRRIQEDLFISEATVKTHLRHIYRKCDTHNRAEIIALFERETACVTPTAGLM